MDSKLYEEFGWSNTTPNKKSIDSAIPDEWDRVAREKRERASELESWLAELDKAPAPENEDRKNFPVTTGLLDYFPDAVMAVANCSKVGNDQHNPGQPLHWAKDKSTDHADCLVRHLLDRDTFDEDGVRHSAKVAWRALALLQTEIDRGE